ncbi:MAG: bifunctional glutamate--cysteine ligase GshA/glutathione synthetase GshB, partial [Bacilli bacterium]
MLERLKKVNRKYIETANFGLEREMLRVDQNGVLATTPHPAAFGDKLRNPYITTDFAESQIEVITPVFPTIKEAHDFSHALYNIVANELDSELLWGQSMPCAVPDESAIQIATYHDNDAQGEQASTYRQRLLEKYGGTKQLISGIHFNFSFHEELLKALYKESGQS